MKLGTRQLGPLRPLVIVACLTVVALPPRFERCMPASRHTVSGIGQSRSCLHRNVLEGLKGIKTGEFQAQFYFGEDLNQFRPDRRYLIFANRAVAGIYKSGCWLTQEITKTGEGQWLPAMRAELSLCLKKP